MHYAIQVESVITDYLLSTARKKSLKHTLLHVEQGMVLVKLGKKEYTVEPGQSFWIPFQCLHVLTILPATRLIRADFSARLKHNFPQQAGYLTPSVLCQAILERLKNCTRQESVYSHLLSVLSDEVLHFRPVLSESTFTHLLQQWQNHCPTPVQGIPPEIHLALLLREAQKKALSGINAQEIAGQLFGGELAHYQQLRRNLLGQE